MITLEELALTANMGTSQSDLFFLPSDDLKSQFIGETREIQLLLLAGNSVISGEPNYSIRKDHRPLPPACPPENTTLPGTLALRFLDMILYKGYRKALQEWFIIAIKTGVHVPPNLLPKLLSIGQNRKELRPILKPVLGERGKWLAKEITNQNWKWILHTPDIPIDEVILEGQNQEDIFINELKNFSPSSQRKFIQNLSKYQWPWSTKLTSVFLNVLQKRFIFPTDYIFSELGFQMDQLVNLAYFVPLEMEQEIIESISTRKANSFLHKLLFSFWTKVKVQIIRPRLVRRFQGILDFRKNMIGAIKNAKASPPDPIRLP